VLNTHEHCDKKAVVPVEICSYVVVIVMSCISTCCDTTIEAGISICETESIEGRHRLNKDSSEVAVDPGRLFMVHCGLVDRVWSAKWSLPVSHHSPYCNEYKNFQFCLL
jgi:hypothetical protein